MSYQRPAATARCFRAALTVRRVLELIQQGGSEEEDQAVVPGAAEEDVDGIGIESQPSTTALAIGMPPTGLSSRTIAWMWSRWALGGDSVAAQRVATMPPRLKPTMSIWARESVARISNRSQSRAWIWASTENLVSSFA